MNGWVVLLWSFVAALVLIVVGIFVALVLMGRINLFPAAEPTIAPTPEVTGVVDPTYSVLVLNASGQDDLDAQMRDTIVKRWEAHTGKRARLKETGERFEELSETRLGINFASEAA